MDHFADKVAIVTGGASGIGQALCTELGQRGAVVVAADINREGVQEVASTIAAAGGRASATHTDVSQAEEVEKLVDGTVAEYGRLDFMFNNAGIAISGDCRDMTLDLWRRIIDTNLWGVIYGTTAAYRIMVAQGFGHIVNTASIAGLVPVPSMTAYATTKHALVGLSTSLRAEAEDLGVKISVACPWFVQTGIQEATTVLKMTREDALASLPRRMMSATQAARVILKGVVRNQARIVFSFPARLAWRLYRIHPALLRLANRGMIDHVRQVRQES